METKKSNQDFQILRGMVVKLTDCEQLSLLHFLMGYLWRDKDLYKGVTAWLKNRETACEVER